MTYRRSVERISCSPMKVARTAEYVDLFARLSEPEHLGTLV